MVASISSMKTICLLLGLALAVFAAAPESMAGIVGSKHDFTSTSTGTTGFAEAFSAPGEGGFSETIQQVCVFCHTPHRNASTTAAPLWNRTTVAPATANYTYQMYTSSTMSASSPVGGIPSGISALCMSCHDGVTSVAVNTLINPPGPGAPNDVTTTMTTGALGDIYWVRPDGVSSIFGWGPNLGNNYPGMTGVNQWKIDLSNDHPISIKYLEAAGMNPIAGIAPLRVFGTSPNQTVECATCHLVHDPTYPPFLAMDNGQSQMCLRCHNK